MNKKQILRIISPGIRIKLSFFTVLLIISIVSVTSIINYNQQKAALGEKIDSEIKVPLEFVNSIVLEIENLNRSLVLTEEFKIRVKEKKKELTKFKRVIVKEETGFLSKLKDLGKSIGINVKKKNIYSSVDTYFSRYLSEKEISEFESKIRSQLKKESGAPIDDKTYLKMRILAEKTATEKINLEKLNLKINEHAENIAYLEKELKNEQLTEDIRKELLQKKDFFSAENKKLDRLYASTKRKELILEAALTKSLQSFFRGYFQAQMSTLGLAPEKIRILSYDALGKETLDTGHLLSNSSQTGKKLLTLKEFTEERNAFFSKTDKREQIINRNTKSYETSGRQYDVSFRPVFRNPNSAMRAISIFQSLSKLESSYDPYLEEDKKIASEFKELSNKLRARLVDLRLHSKTKPKLDKEYRALTKDYQALLAKREKLFDELTPVKKLYQQHLEKKKLDLDTLREDQKKTEIEILSLEESLRHKPDPTIKDFDPEAIQSKIQNLETLLEEQKDTIQIMESSKEDLSKLEDQILGDSYRFLREAALQDFAFVPIYSSSNQMQRYYQDVSYRKLESLKFQTLREWILSGDSETELPKTRGGNVYAESGILVRSRSEAEEMMWNLDSTPILSNKIDQQGLLYDLIQRDLLGYNILIIDRTEGIRQIKKNREETIRYIAIICIIAILLAYIFAWIFVRKLKVISKNAEEIEKGNLKVTFPKAGYDEVGILSDSLNDMVVGLREREEMRGELAAAEEIQKRLLPEKLPTGLSDTIEISAFYKAMTGVGGDYYDFIELADRKLVFCIGDVSNHGVGPAIIMALFRSQLRSILRRGERNLKKILLELNANLYEETPDHIFITFFIGIYDPTHSQIEYVSAGHIKPLFYDSSKNKIFELPAGGLPLGMDENSFFETTIERRGVILDTGDVFFEHTDGLDEARNKEREFFGRERISHILLENGKSSAPELMNAMIAEVERHTAENLSKSGVSNLHDDLAMIAIRKKSDEKNTIPS